MNGKTNEAIVDLFAGMQTEFCEECGHVKIVKEMARDVASEFEIIRRIKGDFWCDFILDSMVTLYDDDQEIEALMLLAFFMKEYKGRLSQYVLSKIIEAGELVAVDFIEGFFNVTDHNRYVIEEYEDEIEEDYDYDKEDEWR